MIFLMLSEFNVVEQANYTGTWILFLLNIPAPIILTIYFLFFGKLIYRLISHFTQGQPTDCMQAAHYSEIIVRFTGLCTLGMMLNRLYASIITVLQSTLVIYFNYPEHLQKNPFATAFRQQFFNIEAIVSLSLYLALSILFAWYFFNKGNLFINLLNRLAFGKIDNISRSSMDHHAT